MPNLSIKDVPDSWAEALRQRAARNHRSLQGELMALVEQAVHDSAAVAHAAQDSGVRRDPRGWPVLRQGSKPPEQVIAELRAKYPQPVAGQPLGADILRHDRDSR